MGVTRLNGTLLRKRPNPVSTNDAVEARMTTNKHELSRARCQSCANLGALSHGGEGAHNSVVRVVPRVKELPQQSCALLRPGDRLPQDSCSFVSIRGSLVSHPFIHYAAQPAAGCKSGG